MSTLARAKKDIDGTGKRLYPVFLRILLNFIQFTAITLLFQFIWPPSLLGTLEALGLFGSGFSTFISVDCLMSDGTNPKPVYVDAIIWAAQPLLIPFIAYFIVALSKYYKGTQAFIACRSRRMSSRRSVNDIFVRGETMILDGDLSIASGRMKDESMVDTTQGHATYGVGLARASGVGSLSSIGLALGRSQAEINTSTISMSRSATVMSEIESYKKVKAEKKLLYKYQLATCALTIAFVLYCPILLAALKLFHCDQIGENRVVLNADMSEQCNDSLHRVLMLALGIPMAILCGVGFPVFCSYLLWQNQFRLREMKASDSRSSNTFESQIQKIKLMPLSLLHSGYKPGMIWCEIIQMLRKLVLVIIVVFVDVGFSQATLGSLTVAVTLTIHVAWLPFEDTICNICETLSQLVSYLVFFYIQVFSSSIAFGAILASFILGFFCFMCYLIIADFIKKNKISGPV